MIRKAGLLLAGLLLALSAYSQAGKTIDWNSDLEFLARELPARHYNLYSVRDSACFRAGIDAIKAGAERAGDFATALKTQQLLATFGDSHTRLNFTPLIKHTPVFPLVLRWTSDGLYVVKTSTEHKELLGRRIVAINRIPMETVIDSLSTLVTVDNQAVVKAIVPELVASGEVLRYFGIADSPQLELMLDGGETHLLGPLPAQAGAPELVSFRPDSLFFAEADRRTYFTDRYFPHQKIYYMLYNRCQSRETVMKRGNADAAKELPSFEEFTQKAFETLRNHPVDKLVFDLRNNGGGDSSIGTAFVEKLARFFETHPAIRIYVVLGRNTFSSAILNAMDFKRLTDAVFVGEQTAGKPNHFGEVKAIRLPSSGLEVVYSTKYFKRSDEEVSTLIPDVQIELSFSDYAKGIDPVFEWVKGQ